MFCDRIIETYNLPKGKCCVSCHDESDGGIHLVKITLRDGDAVVCCNIKKILADTKKEVYSG